MHAPTKLVLTHQLAPLDIDIDRSDSNLTLILSSVLTPLSCCWHFAPRCRTALSHLNTAYSSAYSIHLTSRNCRGVPLVITSNECDHSTHRFQHQSRRSFTQFVLLGVTPPSDISFPTHVGHLPNSLWFPIFLLSLNYLFVTNTQTPRHCYLSKPLSATACPPT